MFTKGGVAIQRGTGLIFNTWHENNDRHTEEGKTGSTPRITQQHKFQQNRDLTVINKITHTLKARVATFLYSLKVEETSLTVIKNGARMCERQVHKR